MAKSKAFQRPLVAVLPAQPATILPVAQHDAFERRCTAPRVNPGSVRVTMDQDVSIVAVHGLRYGAQIYIHNLIGFVGIGLNALRSHLFAQGLTFRQ